MSNNKPKFSILEDRASNVARRLLGSLLERHVNGKVLRARIVETEAYDQTDAASHSYKGETKRTKVMFGEAGFLYVYFTYGMHYCCNVVVGPKGQGAAVLIRAVEPLNGEDIMLSTRAGKSGPELTNGPAKLCQALGIDKSLDGHDLRKLPLKLVIQKPISKSAIVQTTRVGISHAKNVPWRFYIKDNKYVSKTDAPVLKSGAVR